MVYEGPDDKSKLISEVFGTPSHKVVKSISSLGNSIFIDFKKYGGLEQSENGIVRFEAFIKYNKINLDCQFWLNNTILMSPINPKINCSWIITTKLGSYITLDFDFIEVNPICNYYNINKLNYNSLYID